MALEILQQKREREERGEDGSTVEFVIGRKKRAGSPILEPLPMTAPQEDYDVELPDNYPGEITVRVEDWCDRYEDGADLTYVYPYADDDADDEDGAHGEGKFDHDGWVNHMGSGSGAGRKNQVMIPIPASVPPRPSSPTIAPPRDPPRPVQATQRPPMPPSLLSGLGAPSPGAGGMRSPTGMPVFMPTPRPPLADTAK